MSAQAGVCIRHCPLTCGQETKVFRPGWNKACAAKLSKAYELAKLSDCSDPHFRYCLECNGKVPAEVSFITTEEMKMGQQPTPKLPRGLEGRLRPVPKEELAGITIKDLRGYWIKPLLNSPSSDGCCPCCGNKRAYKSSGLCSGCYDLAQRHKYTGQDLLDFLARRAAGGRKKTPPAPASPPSPGLPPSPGAGGVDLPDTRKALILGCKDLLGLSHTTPDSAILAAISSVVDQRDRLEEEAAAVAKVLNAGPDENLAEAAGRFLREAQDNKGLAVMMADRHFAQEKHAAEQLDSLGQSLSRLQALAGKIHPVPEANANQYDTESAVVAKWTAADSDGYEQLAAILNESLAQASTGKWKDRHANGKPFHEQPIIEEALAVGLGFPAGQARKKILEAVRCCESFPDRAIADLLGAINYTAATIIAIRKLVGQELAA